MHVGDYPTLLPLRTQFQSRLSISKRGVCARWRRSMNISSQIPPSSGGEGERGPICRHAQASLSLSKLEIFAAKTASDFFKNNNPQGVSCVIRKVHDNFLFPAKYIWLGLRSSSSACIGKHEITKEKPLGPRLGSVAPGAGWLLHDRRRTDFSSDGSNRPPPLVLLLPYRITSEKRRIHKIDYMKGI